MITHFSKQPLDNHVSSKSIQAYIGVTASGLSRAKKVLRLLGELGPQGKFPDPMVAKRLQSPRKGPDLLKFLEQRLRLRLDSSIQ